MTGSALVLARPDGHRDAGYLAQLIAREEVTTLHFVPSMLRVFLEAPEVAECGCLKRAILSGEALPEELARRFAERLPDAELHNLYGPTEAAIDVTAWPYRRPAGTTVPIGRPIANTRIHLLDSALRPVPLGVPGELCIASLFLVPDAFQVEWNQQVKRSDNHFKDH
ncbi:MAG: AMP-binding protein, partial [bacterium]|nr:AMP-binding protein [bacterium]